MNTVNTQTLCSAGALFLHLGLRGTPIDTHGPRTPVNTLVFLVRAVPMTPVAAAVAVEGCRLDLRLTFHEACKGLDERVQHSFYLDRRLSLALVLAEHPEVGVHLGQRLSTLRACGVFCSHILQYVDGYAGHVKQEELNREMAALLVLICVFPINTWKACTVNVEGGVRMNSSVCIIRVRPNAPPLIYCGPDLGDIFSPKQDKK